MIKIRRVNQSDNIMILLDKTVVESLYSDKQPVVNLVTISSPVSFNARARSTTKARSNS